MRFHKGFQLDPRRLPSPDQAEQALASPADHSQVCLSGGSAGCLAWSQTTGICTGTCSFLNENFCSNI